jgi:hypothetical protein
MHGPCHSTRWWGLNGLKPVKLVQIISNGFEFNSKLIQTLTDSERTFPSSEKLK